jgi:2-oxoglutarate dehydrogenase E2 component (dihydrolipoamide succinyltransferase)
MPAAGRVLGEAGVPAAGVAGTGPGGRVTKSDAVAAVTPPAARPAAALAPAAKPAAPVAKPAAPPVKPLTPATAGAREERYVLISPIRRRIAERLVEAQQQAALLTTFNEVDMSAVMGLRNKFKDVFQERYCDIGIAVGGGKGLVVPVLRNAETLSFAQIELGIADFARRAGENKLKLEELQGGTFTISNGGVYGSMMSTPIINPPQSGILGLHAIQDRPMAVNGQVVIRPMMYLALTYDHRLVDGREAVTFLKRIKDTIEDPTRLMLEV